MCKSKGYRATIILGYCTDTIKFMLAHKYCGNVSHYFPCFAVASTEARFVRTDYDNARSTGAMFYSVTFMNGHQVGGRLNPLLVEEMGTGNVMIAHDTRIFAGWRVAQRAISLGRMFFPKHWMRLCPTQHLLETMKVGSLQHYWGGHLGKGVGEI